MSQLSLRLSLAQQARSEALRRQVLDSATDLAIISLDLTGRVTGWNTGAANILGWTEAEMLGRPADLIFLPEDQAAGFPGGEMARAALDGRAADDRWHRRRDGSRFWASGEMMPLRDERGTHTGYLKLLRDRTEQHLAGQALEAVNERFRLAQRATRDAIWDWSFDDNKVLWNEALEDAYGWTPAQVEPTGDWWIAQIHPGDRARVERGIHAVINGTSTGWTEEYRFRRADGNYADVLDRSYVIRDSRGRPIRMIGAMLDQSERRRADATLRDQANRLRLATTGAGIGIFDYWVQTGELSWDDRCRALFGLSAGAPVSYEGTFLAGLHPEDRARADRAVRQSTDPAGSGHFVAEYRTIGLEDGIERWVSAQGETHFEDGQPVRLIGTVLDITDRKRVEEALRESEAVARQNIQRVQLALAAGAIVGTWFWDLPTDRFTVDEAFARSFGLDPALGRVGLSLEQVVATVHPDDKAGLIAAINEVIARGGAYAHQYRVRRTDGKYYWIEANGRVDLAPDGTPLSFPGVLIDVEERRAVEAERDRATAELRALTETLEQRIAERTADLLLAEEQLRQSQKMEAVGQLTGGIAHDFNNLLTGIIGALELLGARIAQGRYKDVERYVVAAQGAAKRAAALTHRLLAFSRRQTLDPKPTDANRLVAGMEELVRRTVGPSVDLEVVGAGGLWPTLVDPNQLENALLNLCINARDAMPHGGRLTIETANRWFDERAARERDIAPGQYISLCVSDTGMGMSPDIIAKAFDPFFTTKPLGQGTGLGLSMIYGFARQSGGQTRIYSEVGQGTMVCLYLPRHLGEAELAEAVPELAEAPRAELGETVLVVDDDPTVRMLVMEVLEEQGYAAIEAGDGASGLRVLQSDARIDLLVTDVGLPGGMNGRQMADAARVGRPDLKVQFITGYAENAVVGDGHLEPGMHVMTKPFAMEALATRIRDLITAA
ncbi:PAS domain-containing protein (plasmid) [Roseomonas gilardii subsp. gilardii]|uniref:PAS domain-containing protein n=1 Tax=Roseomonas gilardii TaxID=257708 RepID=UPI001FF7BE88|nr:PAS domain-containing protein [Roseomonas gilardii]UPG74822.1 PAS domain-containing protein [Roseomonas gilardii subsp. gilardii]